MSEKNMMLSTSNNRGVIQFQGPFSFGLIFTPTSFDDFAERGCVPDPEGIEEGVPLFMVGSFADDLASGPRPEEPCANNDDGGIGREGSAIEVLDFGIVWVPELPGAAGSCGGGFIGSEGL